MKVFEKLKDILQGYNVESVAEVAGVAPSTIYFWLDGHTKCPRLDTIVKVAGAVGWEISLEHKSGKLRAVA